MPEVKQEVVVQEVESFRTKVERLIKQKQELIVALKAEITELKALVKEHEQLVRVVEKKTKKREANPNRKPSGFAIPVEISEDLFKFLEPLGVKKGEKVSRTSVTKFVTQYIKEHSLQNPEFKREIVPDEPLKRLLGEPLELKDSKDEKSPKIYTYLGLQRYLAVHFPKKVDA